MALFAPPARKEQHWSGLYSLRNSWSLAVIFFLLELNAGQAQTGDGLSSFFSPVADPVKVDAVPASLGKVVQLAESLTGQAGLATPGTADDHRYDTSPAAWSTPEDSEATTHIFDNFDPSTPSMWEQISGGTVSDQCGSVDGKALCFNGVAGRSATTAPVNTLSGGVVRFSIHLGFEDGAPAPVVLEYKSIGRGWMVLETYKEEYYSEAGSENPNTKSLGLVNGGGVHGFVVYAVHLPPEANSAATKFRWRQLREMVSGTLNTWAVDDISIDIDNNNPAVQLTAPHGGGRSGSVLTVVVQFSQPVTGFEIEDIKVENGTVAGLSLFNAQIMGIGAVYTCLVKPSGDGEKYSVVVHVPSHSCINKHGHPNLSSNQLSIEYSAASKYRARADVALGPRPGPADAREAAAWSDGAHIAHPVVGGLKPLKPGQQINPIGKAFNMTELVQDPAALQRKLEEAENMYRRVKERKNPAPPPVILEKLEKEIKTLKSVQKRMMDMDQMAGVERSHGAYGHAMDAELHEEMDLLRAERAEMSRAMEAQRSMREELLREREALRADREEAARAAQQQADDLKRILDQQKHEIEELAKKDKEEREAFAKEHEGHHHMGGHGHKHKHKKKGHEHAHGDGNEHGHGHGEEDAHGTSSVDDMVCDDETGTCTLREPSEEHDHEDHEDYEDYDIHDEMAEIAAEQVSRILHEGIKEEKDELAREKEALAAEKERLRVEVEEERRRREQFAVEQQKLMEELMAEQRRLRVEAARVATMHEDREREDHAHAPADPAAKEAEEKARVTEEKAAKEAEEVALEKARLAEEKKQFMAELEAEREQRRKFQDQQAAMFQQMMDEQRRLRVEAMAVARHAEDAAHEEHAEEGHAHDHGHDHPEHADEHGMGEHDHDHASHDEEVGSEHDHAAHAMAADHIEMVKQRMAAERDELEAARLALVEERERLAAEKEREAAEKEREAAEKERVAAEKERELEAEKERLRLRAEEDDKARAEWRLEQQKMMDEQKKFMEEMMAQTRMMMANQMQQAAGGGATEQPQ